MCRLFLVVRVVFGIVGTLIALGIAPILLIYLCETVPQLLLGALIDSLIIAGCIWLMVNGVNRALSEREGPNNGVVSKS